MSIRLLLNMLNDFLEALTLVRSLMLVWLCTALTVGAFSAYPQSSRSGLNVDYRLGMMNEADRTPNLVNREFGDGSGLSRESVFRLEYTRSVPMWPSSSLNIEAVGGLSQSVGSFSGSAFSLLYSATSLHVASGIRSKLGWLQTSFGAWLEVPLTETLTETINATGQTRSSGLLHPGLPFGLRIEAGLAGRLFPGLPISPSLFGEFDFKAFRQPEIPIINAVSGGLALRWRFEDTSPEPPPVNSNPVVESPPFKAYSRDPLHRQC